MASRASRSETIRRALAGFVAADVPPLLVGQRWFAAKGRAVTGASLRAAAALPEADAWLVVVDVDFGASAGESYALVLAVRRVGDGGTPLGRVIVDGVPLAVVDGLAEPASCAALLAAIEREATLDTLGGVVRCRRTAEFPRGTSPDALVPRPLGGEQSNTSIVYGDRLVLKVLRRLTPGVNPDTEITRFLTERTAFRAVPLLAGTMEWIEAGAEPTTVGVLKRFVANQGDAWNWVGAHLTRVRQTLGPDGAESRVREAASPMLAALGRLGALTAELHAALASAPDDPAFAPEPITRDDVARWGARLVADFGETASAVRDRLRALPPALAGRAETALARATAVAARAADLRLLVDAGCAKIRAHGDYHLGQVLRTDEGFVILDFEGEPIRSLGQRRAKHCALVDVAGMLRSLDYAGAAARPDARAPEAWVDQWVALASGALLAGYSTGIARAPVTLVPPTDETAARVRRAFELDKALYEVRYELGHRPAWLPIPLAAVTRALAEPAA